MPAPTQLIDPSGGDVMVEVLTMTDRLEFLANESKAKDRDQQALRLLKKLRDYLNTSGLDDFKLGPRFATEKLDGTPRRPGRDNGYVTGAGPNGRNTDGLHSPGDTEHGTGPMIVLVSNGKAYSDHRLYFVDAPSTGAVEAVMHPHNPYDDYDDESLNTHAKVVGTIEGLLTWKDQSASRVVSMSLESFKNQALEYL